MSPPDRRRLSASSKQGGLPPHGEIPRRTGRDDRCCTYRGGRSRLPRPSTRAEYAHLAGALACHLSVAKKLFDDRRGIKLDRDQMLGAAKALLVELVDSLGPDGRAANQPPPGDRKRTRLNSSQ